MIFLRMFSGYLLQVIPFAFLCFYPFTNHFRYTKKLTLAATMGIIFLMAAFFSMVTVYLNAAMPQSHILWQTVNLVFMCCLIPCLVWYLFAIKVNWQKKLFIFAFATTCALAITSVNNILLTSIYINVTYDDRLPYFGYTIPILIGITILTMPLFWLLLKRAYLPVKDSLSKKESGYLSLMAVILFAILASGLSFIGFNLLLNPMGLFLFFALMVSIYVIYFVVFKMFAHAHEKLTTMQKYNEVQRQLAIHEEQYRRIHENIESNRRMRHDLRHHLVTLRGFLSVGDLEKAEEYLRQYISQSEDYALVKLCDHPVINMLVSYYQGTAKEKNIAFHIHINIPHKISLFDSDSSVLIGNLLENAIEAVNHAQGEYRYVTLNIICSGKMLVITVDNGFDGKTNKPDGQYLSIKENHIGIGLESIKSIAENYGGGVEFTHDALTFHASVMLSLK